MTNQIDPNATQRKIAKTCCVITGITATGLLLYQRINNLFCDAINLEENYLPTDWNALNSAGLGMTIYGFGFTYLWWKSIGDYAPLPTDLIETPQV